MANRPSVSVNPIKYLSKLEVFDGNPNNLFTFVNLIDRILPIMSMFDDTSQELFGDLIKSRLKDRAREVIEINCQAVVWSQIKEVLFNNFGEKKSCEDLFEDLRSTEFKKNSITFFNDIKSKLRNLNNKTVIVLGTNAAASQTCMNNMRTALNIFKSKIPEPMKTILACRNPTTLEGAMDILHESGYADLDPTHVNHFNKIKKFENQSRHQNSNKFEKNHNFHYNNSNGNPKYNNNLNYNQNFQNYDNRNNNSSNGFQNRNTARFSSSRHNYNNNNNFNTNHAPQFRANQPPTHLTPSIPTNNRANAFNGNSNNYPAPEPMDVNHQQFLPQTPNMENSANFLSPASTPTYHL